MSNPTTTQPSSPEKTVLLVDPSTVIGPIFLGNSFNWLFMGLLVMQVYTYWRNFPKDRVMVKMLVYIIFTLDLTQTAFGTHEAWWFAIQNWGNISALQGGSWTTVISPIMCGIISAMVQIFYAYRIWALRRNIMPRLLAILIILLALTQALAAIIGSLLLETNLTQENLIRLHPIFSLWLAGSFTTDVLVTGSMIWILHTSKSTSRVSQTDSLLNRLILNTIQTGTVTVICAGVGLALFIVYTDRNYYFAFTYILGKLYSNSFMATINSRAPRRHSEQSESIGMRIQVSRRTERETDDLELACPKSRNPIAIWQTTSDLNAENITAQRKEQYDLTDTDALPTIQTEAV
ncbi:hypothetical protein B0H11DRAFT_2277736 [Mycena galericulata]|nr:hypothetical protein B0H11DRAFT_2114487 [Mycena galericulata]KAJ7491784.1 hypothetical protein B0H11DRAFT_2277736 [Mycena galericulata]